MYVGKADPCKKALSEVLHECPSCGDCKLEHAGCVPAAAPEAPKFDCLAGYSEWKTMWTPDKRHWCCREEHRGCDFGNPKPDSRRKKSSEPYDCLAGLSNWRKGWSKTKRDWCFCKQDKIPLSRDHCSATTAAPSTTPRERESRTASEDVVLKDSYDCHAGLATWSTSWSGEKKTWCCEHQEVHCNPQPQQSLLVTARVSRLQQLAERHWLPCAAAAAAIAGLGSAGVLVAISRWQLGSSSARRSHIGGVAGGEPTLLPADVSVE